MGVRSEIIEIGRAMRGLALQDLTPALKPHEQA